MRWAGYTKPLRKTSRSSFIPSTNQILNCKSLHRFLMMFLRKGDSHSYSLVVEYFLDCNRPFGLFFFPVTFRFVQNELCVEIKVL